MRPVWWSVLGWALAVLAITAVAGAALLQKRADAALERCLAGAGGASERCDPTGAAAHVRAQALMLAGVLAGVASVPCIGAGAWLLSQKRRNEPNEAERPSAPQ